MSAGQDVGRLPRMELVGRNEVQATVAMCEPVPLNEACDPVACLFQRCESLGRISGAVFAGSEQGLGVRVVVADARTAPGRGDAESVEGFQHRSTLHGAAVVRTMPNSA